MGDASLLLGIAEGIRTHIPGNIEIKESFNNVTLSGQMDVGIKGIDINIECLPTRIKIKGTREYKYPIATESISKFHNEMKGKYPDYNFYVTGQVLSFSKFYSYNEQSEAINPAFDAIDAMSDIVKNFEESCVNFLESQVDNNNEDDSEYNPEDNINLVNVDNSYHAVSTTEQDNEEYFEEHKDFAEEVFNKLVKSLGGQKNGNEMVLINERNEKIRCVLFPMDAEILISISIPVSRDIGAMYVSFMNSNYPDIMSSYNSETEEFTLRRYSTPDKYAPEETEEQLQICLRAMDECIAEYKQTLEKKDSADFASDVQKILVEQTESIAERERAISEREEYIYQKEIEIENLENEYNEQIKSLEAERNQMQEEIEAERARIAEYESEMNEKIRLYEERNTKDILNLQQLANQVAMLQNRLNNVSNSDDSSQEEIFRLKSKVTQMTSQKIALEKKLKEQLAAKDTKIRNLSDLISQKEKENKEIENNISDMVKSKITEEKSKLEKIINDLQSQLDSIGHITTPEEVLEFYKNVLDEDVDVRLLHAPNAEFVVFKEDNRETRIRLGDVNYVDVSTSLVMKEKDLKRLNSDNINFKFFSKGSKVIVRGYFSKNAQPNEIDEIIVSMVELLYS